MFKLVALFAFVAVASAAVYDNGHSGLGLVNNGYGGHGQVQSYAAPVQVAVAPAGGYNSHASSYANHNSISVHPVPVVISHGNNGHNGY
ncbi:hypothetical protein FQR65_LT07271 [Abscondita terminalis]|nr:hypothetical protein FQR65_LT07271 [Abscondita terminalis]